MPTGSADLVIVATPPLSCALPRVVVPFLKVTAPVGAGPDEVTVAVKTIACFKAEGLGLELAEILVGFLLIACVRNFDVLAAKVPSPP